MGLSVFLRWIRSTGPDFATGPIAQADGFADLPTFVSMLLSLLGTTLHVLHMMPMVLDHFRDLFVGLRHDDSASLGLLT